MEPEPAQDVAFRCRRPDSPAPPRPQSASRPRTITASRPWRERTTPAASVSVCAAGTGPARPPPLVHLVAHLVHADRGCGAVRGAGIYWISPVKHSRPVFGAMRPLHPPGRPQRGSGAAESMRSPS